MSPCLQVYEDFGGKNAGHDWACIHARAIFHIDPALAKGRKLDFLNSDIAAAGLVHARDMAEPGTVAKVQEAFGEVLLYWDNGK